MKIFNFSLKIIVQILFVTFILSTSPAKSLDKFNKSDRISDYFSGILLLNDNQYEKSFNFLKKLNGLEASHINYSIKYLYSLVNSGNLKEAFNYSKKLEKQKLDSFESNLVMGIFYLKNSNLDLAQKYFLKAKTKNSKLILNNFVSNFLYSWSKLDNYDLREASLELKKLDQRFENLKKIQNVFLNCYFNSSNTNNLFEELISNKKTDFSRFNYFYASYSVSLKKIDKAKDIINSALKSYPRNLLLNQYKLDLNQGNIISIFDCKNKEHIIAEILYITSNALSSQSIYSLAKKIYNNIGKKGGVYKWHASKQLAKIYIQEENKKKALELVSIAYNNLAIKDIYETFDYAEFLKNNEKFEESIPFYTKVISEVKKDHLLYAESTDGRGVAYERTGEWDKAEKDLLASLDADSEQAYVINYLAYTWIEQGVKIEKSLSMLEKANKLRSNDPYITDSLGWALFKLKKYREAKEYLQLAVKLMPGDPVVNDHYGDVLWKNGNEIQARYYWNYVLNLKKTEEELKKTIEQKLIKGL